ncbi:hypothetical protein NC651_035017 [Populus alba x Populus x berolinensis]|nr:hypothetical protein NC651_035017 [Populus alba x Populus x berolinensis]
MVLGSNFKYKEGRCGWLVQDTIAKRRNCSSLPVPVFIVQRRSPPSKLVVSTPEATSDDSSTGAETVDEETTLVLAREPSLSFGVWPSVSPLPRLRATNWFFKSATVFSNDEVVDAIVSRLDVLRRVIPKIVSFPSMDPLQSEAPLQVLTRVV